MEVMDTKAEKLKKLTKDDLVSLQNDFIID
jgi:hypothetical protein